MSDDITRDGDEVTRGDDPTQERPTPEAPESLDTPQEEAVPETPPAAGKGGMDRRDLLKALATVPVFGALGYTALHRKGLDAAERRRLLEELGMEDVAPAELSEIETRTYPETIRVGIVGYGGEGESLVRSPGFAQPDWIQAAREAGA